VCVHPDRLGWGPEVGWENSPISGTRDSLILGERHEGVPGSCASGKAAGARRQLPTFRPFPWPEGTAGLPSPSLGVWITGGPLPCLQGRVQRLPKDSTAGPSGPPRRKCFGSDSPGCPGCSAQPQCSCACHSLACLSCSHPLHPVHTVLHVIACPLSATIPSAPPSSAQLPPSTLSWVYSDPGSWGYRLSLMWGMPLWGA
jgi:hypothetical protein